MFRKHKAKLPHGVNAIVSEILAAEDANEDQPDQGRVTEETDRIPSELFVERYHIACFVISILSYTFDIGSDVFIGVSHYHAGRTVAAIFVAVFALIPSIVINTISFAWEADDRGQNYKVIRDEKPEKKYKELTAPLPLVLLLCVFQLGPIWWHAKAIYYGLQFRKTADEKQRRFFFCRMIEAERDATLLRLLEGFLESAPQLIIQSTVLYEFVWLRLKVVTWNKLPTWVYFQLGSLSLSLFSLCWSITSQHRTIRIATPDKVNVHPHETALQLIWRGLTIFSRMLTIGICVMHWKFNAFILGGIHVAVSLIHISALQAIDFGPGRGFLEFGALLVVAFLHIFAPFNVVDGQTRWRYFVAYMIEFIEGIFIFYLLLTDIDFHFSWKTQFAIASGSSFAAGLLFMAIYYCCFHPNRRRHKRITTTDGDLTDTEV